MTLRTTTRETTPTSSVLLQKYLAHYAVDTYIGIHGHDNEEVAAQTG